MVRAVDLQAQRTNDPLDHLQDGKSDRRPESTMVEAGPLTRSANLTQPRDADPARLPVHAALGACLHHAPTPERTDATTAPRSVPSTSVRRRSTSASPARVANIFSLQIHSPRSHRRAWASARTANESFPRQPATSERRAWASAYPIAKSLSYRHRTVARRRSGSGKPVFGSAPCSTRPSVSSATST